MSKIVVVGAGKTGRGFIARLLQEASEEVIFIDKKYQNVLLSIKDIPECSLFVTTVNGVKKQLVYKPHVFTISIKNKVYYKDVLIAFADISKECLINPYLLL